eukprot:g840.t1
MDALLDETFHYGSEANMQALSMDEGADAAIQSMSLITTGSAGGVDVAFGFPNEYNCFGRIFDEPRSLRLQCTKNPRRQLNCKCDEASVNSRAVRCDCKPLIGDARDYKTAPPRMPLLRKFVNKSTIFPTKIESPRGRPGAKHILD